jgi:MerR family copper efflux transcriptional regulator
VDTISQALLRIGEVAAQAGVSPRTVDFYTSLGLLTPAARTEAFAAAGVALIDRVRARKAITK